MTNKRERIEARMLCDDRLSHLRIEVAFAWPRTVERLFEGRAWLALALVDLNERKCPLVQIYYSFTCECVRPGIGSALPCYDLFSTYLLNHERAFLTRAA